MINDEFLNDDACDQMVNWTDEIFWSVPIAEDADCIALLNSIYEAEDILLGDINASFGDISNDS